MINVPRAAAAALAEAATLAVAAPAAGASTPPYAYGQSPVASSTFSFPGLAAFAAPALPTGGALSATVVGNIVVSAGNGGAG